MDTGEGASSQPKEGQPIAEEVAANPVDKAAAQVSPTTEASSSSSSGLKAAKAKDKARSKPYARPAGRTKPSNNSPILLALALFRTGDDSKQLAGTVFLKTAPDQTVERVIQSFCRWAEMPPEACTLFDGRKNEQLNPSDPIDATGLTNSSPVIIYITKDAPVPSAQAQAAPFTIVDVVDSELAGLGGGLGM